MTDEWLEAERREFESWARPSWFVDRRHSLKPDEYQDAGTQCAWLGWLARARKVPAALQQAPATVDTNESVAVRFYQDNPSAALFDFRNRMLDPCKQAPAQEPVAWDGIDLDGMVEAFHRVIEAHAQKDSPFHQPVNADAMLALRILRGIVPAMKRYTHPPQST